MSRETPREEYQRRLYEAGKALRSPVLLDAAYMINAEISTLAEENAALKEENKALWEAAQHIADMCGDNNCMLDHHGYCQEHGYLDDDCIYPRMRALVEQREMGVMPSDTKVTSPETLD